MATRARNSTRSTTSRSDAYRRDTQGDAWSNYRDDSDLGSREGMSSGTRGGLRRQVSEGIRVSAEMPNAKVARITIDVDWQHLVSRVARTVRRRIKNRSAPAGRTRSTAARPRRSRAS